MGRGGPSLLRVAATTAVVAGTATAVSGGIHGHQQQKAAEQQAEIDQAQAAENAQLQAAQNQAQLEQMQAQLNAQQMAAAAPVAPPPAASSGADRMTQLQQLAELKQAGVLNDAEFEAEKARILASA